ncbi:MAG: dihydrofolate reductase [Candidatus Wildermuthbacteria bacterium]|nr:dihydrofolate reductase [Candidatus Wildermuthbacteria bacterium]
MLVSIIVAMGNNRVIGRNNKLPWDLPEDLEHFKKMTLGKPVIMGQRTFESIGKVLPGRTNIILTKDDNFNQTGCLVAHSLEEALSLAKDAKEVMICGGSSVYRQFLPLADRMYLTMVEGDYQGDAFFPEFDWSDWQEVERENHDKYSFITLDRK